MFEHWLGDGVIRVMIGWNLQRQKDA